jgi:hypothetical protein
VNFEHASALTNTNTISILRRHCAPVAEPVDAADSKSVFERSGSSSLPRGTIELTEGLDYQGLFLCLA